MCRSKTKWTSAVEDVENTIRKIANSGRLRVLMVKVGFWFKGFKFGQW